MYTGEDFVNYSTKDSTGKIMSKALWAEKIKDYSLNYYLNLYLPLTDKASYPVPDDSTFVDNKHTFEFIGEDTINNISCYHVKMNTISEDDSTEMLKTFRIENNYWISKQDYLPIQSQKLIVFRLLSCELL